MSVSDKTAGKWTPWRAHGAAVQRRMENINEAIHGEQWQTLCVLNDEQDAERIVNAVNAAEAARSTEPGSASEPQKCPTCGKPEQNEVWCPDPWHLSWNRQSRAAFIPPPAHSEVEGLHVHCDHDHDGLCCDRCMMRSDAPHPGIRSHPEVHLAFEPQDILDLAAALRSSLSVQPEVEGALREALRETDLAMYPYPGEEGGCIVSGGDNHDVGVCEVCALHARNVALLDSQRKP